jgi:AcrR family transcriptional regulator
MTTNPRPRGGRPRDPAIDERVLAAARDLITKQGLQNFTLDAAAEAAGVSRGAIYRRWASTDELILDVLDDALGQLHGPNPSIPAGQFWEEAREGLETAVKGLANPIEHGAIQIWLSRLTHQPALQRRYWQRRIQPRRERAIESLHQAATHGEIQSADDADLLIDMLAGVLVYRYFLTPPELRTAETDQEWLDRLVNLAQRLLSPNRDEGSVRF